MACLFPRQAFYARDVGPSGKRGITFQRSASLSGIGFKVPCQQCVECRLSYAADWAVRCVHESKMHDHNAFVTLTYDDMHMPEGRTLVRRDMQLFMKRLRKVKGTGIRFFGCGEYSPTMWRPHYHLLLFNCKFGDKKFYKSTPRGEKLYTSDELFELWPYGMNAIGEVTYDSAAYCAGYVTKKITGEKSDTHYMRYSADGSPYWLLPEFAMCSRRPGVGATFYAAYGRELVSNDTVVMNAKLRRLPRFYDTRYELTDADGFAKLKRSRRRRAVTAKRDMSYYRRRAREVILLRKAKGL